MVENKKKIDWLKITIKMKEAKEKKVKQDEIVKLFSFSPSAPKSPTQTLHALRIVTTIHINFRYGDED